MLNINYTTLYGEQMRRLFANMMQTNPLMLGPYVAGVGSNSSARVQYMPWDKYDPTNTSIGYPTNATILDPVVGWEVQYPALINGFYFGATTLSLDWVQQMRIFSAGGSDTISIAAADQVHYTDPFTGTEYIARNYGTEQVAGVTTARGSGHRMLQYATNIATAAYASTPDPVTGAPVWTEDPVTHQPQCTLASADLCSAAATQIRRFSSNLDTLRELASTLGYGPADRQ